MEGRSGEVTLKATSNTTQNQDESCTAILWLLRIVMYGFPWLVGYAAWVLAGYVPGAENPLGRIFYTVANMAGILVLMNVLILMCIDGPRAAQRRRFWEQKKATAEASK